MQITGDGAARRRKSTLIAYLATPSKPPQQIISASGTTTRLESSPKGNIYYTLNSITPIKVLSYL